MSKPPSPSLRVRSSTCPLCKRPASADHTPFCSQGCKDRDLLNWLGDSYRVPGPPADLSEPDTLDSER